MWRYQRKARNESHTDSCSERRRENAKRVLYLEHGSVSNTTREERQGDVVKCFKQNHSLDISQNQRHLKNQAVKLGSIL